MSQSVKVTTVFSHIRIISEPIDTSPQHVFAFSTVGKPVRPQSSLVAGADEPTPDETIEEEDKTVTTHVIARQDDLTLAEIQEIEKCLRLRAFLLCVYASVWGMGGHLVGEASRTMCSAYVRQVSRWLFYSFSVSPSG